MTYTQSTNQRKEARNYGSIALLLLAFLCVCGIGVGFAYMALTSEQDINQNTLDDSYIALYTNSTDVLDVIAFDTVTDGSDVTSYKVHTDSTIAIGGVDTAVQKISVNPWNVTVTETNADSPTYGLKVTVSAFTPTPGLHYVMVLDDGDAFEVAVAYNNGWTFTGLDYDTDYNVALYVYGTATTLASGFTNYDGTANPVIEGSVFKFVATAESA